ncbi:MAG: hypothetical protein QOD69_3262, partial [Solirubrobacteraceae bacterium]|nr:hypothetical protein [Solirubrobacteraceae bacterium]
MRRAEWMRVMLGELEAHAARAREHELRLMEGVREAQSWSRWEDREWIAWAAAEAKVSREDTEARVAQGRARLAGV